MKKIALVVHNVRSAHNVGSLLRTADGLGLEQIYLTGYTPYPKAKNDQRLPHIQNRTHNQIHKTALGAEENINWQHIENIDDCLSELKASGYEIVALEQTPQALPLHQYIAEKPIALIVGAEVTGLDKEIIEKTDKQLQIPMLGKKESFNVAVAAAIGLYHLRYS
jgi:23S rRNA (guanosine2251-2'-O)-methyltransferase